MRVMVSGGAGYIGAHTVDRLRERGSYVIVADDLTTGSANRIPGVPLLRLDLTSDGSATALTAALLEHEIDAVIHFAARKQVGESVERAAWYYHQNIGSLANVLMAMESAVVRRLVFSSSAAVYGEANGEIEENHCTAPMNPYGETKLVGEWMVAAASRAWGLAAASLRYFNVAGAGRAELGDTHALNLVPLVFERLAAGEAPLIFGDDYDTADGTCIRDYVHVLDVADAHLATLDALDPAVAQHVVLNVGTGRGTSVRQMIEVIRLVSGINIEPAIRERRVGDPASVVASVDRIRQLTGWSSSYGLEQVVASAWASHEYFARAHWEKRHK